MQAMSQLTRVDVIDATDGSPEDLFLVASSFEPRSVRASSLWTAGSLTRAVVFNYEDTLDTVIGRHHARQIRRHLADGCNVRVHTLPCYFMDPYSVVRVFGAFLSRESWARSVHAVTVDATCFTKVHLLLLLQYLHMHMRAKRVRVCYTEPLSYATAFGKALSYGIESTVYLPYQPARHSSAGVGLVAFLGHERLRLERIVQELEPDISAVVFGEPAFDRNMQDYSRRVNESLIHRSMYDGQYRLVTASTKDPSSVASMLRDEVEKMTREGYDTVYIAPLGTKLQALGIELLRRFEVPARLLLAYSIPKRYEKSVYSQGSGPTHIVNLVDEVGRKEDLS